MSKDSKILVGFVALLVVATVLISVIGDVWYGIWFFTGNIFMFTALGIMYQITEFDDEDEFREVPIEPDDEDKYSDANFWNR